MKKVLHYSWLIIKFILNITKHVFLFSLYCYMPDKYSGVTYDEWLGETKTDDVIDARDTKE